MGIYGNYLILQGSTYTLEYGKYLILQGSTYTWANMELSDTPGVQLYTGIYGKLYDTPWVDLYTGIYGNYLILQVSNYTRSYIVII